MPRIDSEKFYTSAINTYGTSAQGVNWTSQETQNLRFDILLSLLPSSINSLADAGCGFGDFHTYIQNQKHTLHKYIGIDSLSDMISIARERTKQEIIKADITKDEIPYADYYICSGAMNVLNTFETHLFIRNCFSASRKGFVFNILHGSKESDTYNYLSTLQIEKIAKSLNVQRIILKDNYMENDITVGFFHV